MVGSAVLVVCQMVILRYFLGASTIWQTEYVTFALVGATFIGCPYVALIKGHVNVDLLPLALNQKARLRLALLASGAALLFSLIVCATGFELWLEAWRGGWRTDTIWALPPLDSISGDAGWFRRSSTAVCRGCTVPTYRVRDALWDATRGAFMNPLVIGGLVGVATLLVLSSGIPVAFGLGLVAIVFLLVFEGVGTLSILAETLFAGLAEFTLVSIPMFILMGAAVANSPAGRDLYEALDRWLHRVPGGLILSNLGACSIFAALSGSSPATCAAIGKMGIPEMRQRGYPADLATGAIAAGGTLGILIPPSITMIVYGISTETSIGRLFIAGVLPGLMLTALFMGWALFAAWRGGYRFDRGGARFTLADKLKSLVKVLPFLMIIAGILYVLYGGVATPSEAAGVGAFICIVLVAVIYKMWRPSQLWTVLSHSMRESVMILMIIGTSAVFSYMLSSLFVTQSVAEWIAALDVNRWVLMLAINLFLIVAGFFLPPVAVIVMTAPILLPIIEQAGFDPYWFAVVLTINMEIGLITPPVGLNLYVINGIVPDVSLPTVLRGALPFMVCMVFGILLLCVFPGLATWLPTLLMGPAI